MSDAPKALALAVFGLAEGYVFVKAGVIAPQAFRDQMEFKSFIIMKLFFSAVGFSMVSQGVMSIWDGKRFDASRLYSNQQVGLGRAVAGCFTLGIGMYIAGSGPTMIPAQVFSGVKTGPLIVLGSLLGGALYGLMEKVIGTTTAPKSCPRDTSADGKLGVSYAAIALPAGAILIGATLALEQFFPHANDLARIANFNVPNPWLPIIAGAVIGINQIPIRLLANKGQGGSSSIMNIVSTATGGFIAPNFQLKAWKDSYQLMYVYVGTSLGALAAAMLAGNAYRAADGYSTLATVGGSALMLFGARYAMGCTCGHGISGMSELSLSSIAAGMSIFAGGIFAGLAKLALGL